MILAGLSSMTSHLPISNQHLIDSLPGYPKVVSTCHARGFAQSEPVEFEIQESIPLMPRLIITPLYGGQDLKVMCDSEDQMLENGNIDVGEWMFQRRLLQSTTVQLYAACRKHGFKSDVLNTTLHSKCGH
jgi:hypothetical protein